MLQARIEKSARSLLVGIAFLLPIIFLRRGTEAFDLVKATLLWISAATFFPVLVFLLGKQRRRPPIEEGALAVLLAGLVMSTLLSSSVAVSFWGQGQRYTGLLTMAACTFLCVGVARLFNEKSVAQVAVSLALAGTVVSTYGFLQVLDRDPFEWSTNSFGRLVIGTMGNPNTGSGMISMSLPLLLWVFMDSARSLAIRSGAGASVGLTLVMLAEFNSFQGQVASLASIGFVLISLWWDFNFGRLLISTLVTIGLVLIPNLGFSWGLASGLSVIVFFSLLPFSARIGSKLDVTTQRRNVFACGGLAAVVLGVAFGSRIVGFVSQGVEGGLIERGDFYRAGWRAFLSRPFFGTGIETFGFEFTRFRPIGHAVNLEGSRTNSVHSVHLGMFANGGVLVGFAFLLIFVVTAVKLVKALRRSQGESRLLLLALGSAWLASHIQGVVSVEHVALLSTQFVLTGAVWAASHKPEIIKARQRKLGAANTALLVISTCALFIFSLVVFTRPLQANIHSKDGMISAYVDGDGDGAMEKLTRATELASWEPLYLIQKIEVEAALGRTEEAALDSLRALELSQHNPGFGIELARVIASTGRYELASEQIELVIQADPYARRLKSNAAALYAEMGSTLVNNGDSVRAQDYFERALVHDPSNAVALQGLATS